MAWYKIVLRDDAKEDIEVTVAYFNLQKQGLSQKFLDEVFTAMDKLATGPELYGFLHADPFLRFIRVNKFPFNIIFEITGGDVVVYAIRHTGRLPFV